MDHDFLDADAVCTFFGGNNPIDRSTLYRGIKLGRYPPPVKISAQLSRWLRSECEAARARLIAQRESAA